MDKTEAMLKSMQEREREHFLLLSLSTYLANVSGYDELLSVVNGELKDNFLFDYFAIGTTNQEEMQYQLFFHNDVKIAKQNEGIKYDVNDGFFNSALQSADPLIFDCTFLSKKTHSNSFITDTNLLGIREIIALPLQYHKNNPSVLFLFFKKPQTLDRNALRLLRGLKMALALTVSNILLLEKIENIDENASSISFQTAKNQNGNEDSEIIGNSDAIQKVKTLINQVASSDSGVLILGESGTGKEVVAREIHQNSSRRKHPMIKVNCAAIPVNLIESELFGHEKGSFTGAVEKRIGKFELAHNGTLFLDEIGDLPTEMQTKLLRVLQEKEFERIGGKKAIKVNVRIIAATNRDLQLEMQEGRFRKDLFFRLNIFPILVPPLRNRKEDIPELCLFFLNKYAHNCNKKNIGLSANALKSILNYSWPGNIRELEHCLERSILLTNESTINEVSFLSDNEKIMASNSFNEFQIKPLKEMEKEYILKVIKMCNGRISGPNGAAVKLEIPSTTLISKMQKLGIKKKHFLE
ncbi:sigma 54-interacting transcriptional regulator [Flavobacterium sp. ANB]|uniref:sigma-54 interaction domain-containing protein n=1 Tax=unclassified Flavobacterium TaxID=196869 RepID=UPI0012B7CAEC|nr:MULTISPECIES: sigma 54-interacting transcriptional regulator [unclassified Flavobacterium]MBF4515540.1 sigma 54-interacting transcriptional regulator [Flavobacterium sp. ANB]MTD68543.1 AAA family ATPase [Flavobacterium sp. LC2016-13]